MDGAYRDALQQIHAKERELQAIKSQLDACRETIEQRGWGEHDLGEEQEKLRLIAENVGAVLWINTPGIARVVYASRAYEQIWQKPCEVLYQYPESLREAVHPEDREIFNAMLQLDERGERYDMEFRIVRPDQSVRWIRDQGFPVHDPSGRLRYMVGVASDITRLKYTEQRLAQEKRELENLLEHSPDVMIRFDQHGTIHYLNAAWERFSGQPREPYLGASFTDLALNPRDAAARHHSLRTVFETHSQTTELHQFVHGDNQFEVRLVPEYSPEGQIQRVLAVARDITERKHTEEALRKTTHDLNERIKELDCLYRIASFTQQRERAVDELVPGALEALVEAYQYPEIACARMTIQGREYHTEPFRETPWRQAEPIAIEGEATGVVEVFYREAPPLPEEPFLKDEAALLRAVANMMGRYLKERREWISRLQAEEELRRANDELEKFAYIASHDLRAPLRAVSNLSSWLEEDLGPQLPDEHRRSLELLRERVGLMDTLIKRLLAYSRAGGKTLQVQMVDTSRLIREILTTLERPEPFHIDIAEGMPELVTDRDKLQQVFANLLANAIEYHDRSDGHVRVSAQDLGDFYAFSVADDGPGIPPEYQGEIFQMFRRGPAAHNREGTGIGLAVVKKLVESVNGHIELQSAPGVGSTFRFTWPKVLEAEPSP